MSREPPAAMTLEEAVTVFMRVRRMLERAAARGPAEAGAANDPRAQEARPASAPAFAARTVTPKRD